jgi:phospholipid/cholesterol/gamma-HCH transport system ATP-binding protein
MTSDMEAPDIHIEVRALTAAYGSLVIQQDLDFTIRRGQVFIVMGGSGCGKTTLLRHMVGLMRPVQGDVLYDGESFWNCGDDGRQKLMRKFGVMYQSGALWSSMTLAENVGLALEQFTDLGSAEIREIASFKLALVGLAGFEDFHPPEISGGMRKRVGVARAMALDPDILFFDEPSAGLDPVSARRLDDLLLELRDSLGTTMVVVTHELSSILAIGDDSVFLDQESRTMLATGKPTELLETSTDPRIRRFLTRGTG